ncbi:phosphatase PAP2/dual specificity phosphatase family protein [Yersinia pekkanenii]|uniref:Dual specificity phosphatase n=1 Tax=Yersinia pekkanenii TaxID=1288385 RepID=A0A0T9NZK5_9GAMM|nr:phosphatase PAP2/dual specificity phosphatase family protein [Yersinia pekkanenii]CNH37927.1 putative dual specificity phosphatase [Yersinia pekkanenii]CRY65184.1 putative dual specificity phosphatase [Yersinia pekkanenii]
MTDVDIAVTRITLWRRAVLWLLLLAPLFFISYGQVNHFTASRFGVGSVVYGWEQQIPFLPWTIVPYWSIDLLYGLSLFICTSVREQTRHALRLVMASLVACLGFLLFPLKFSFVRPITDGPFGWLFQQLELFDLPYNQAPSLHIMLTWLLWLRFWPHCKGRWRGLMSGWFALIAVSVLTTWQHHMIDIITGVAAGVVVSYLIPIKGGWRWQSPCRPSLTLALGYGCGAILAGGLAWWASGSWNLLWWLALSLLAVAAGYTGWGVAVFQKEADGRVSPSALLLLWPYRLGARLSMYWFTRRLAQAIAVAPGVYIGSYPRTALSQASVLDVTAEFSRSRYSRNKPYLCCPLMDLVVPDQQQLAQAVGALNQLHRQHGTVLVHCALGMSRSALVIAAWLLEQGWVTTPVAAAEFIRQCRPQVVLQPRHLRALALWQNRKALC